MFFIDLVREVAASAAAPMVLVVALGVLAPTVVMADEPADETDI